MNKSPQITVLMAVNNGESFVAEAIESILQQSFGDFEFLIVDDASTDNSRDVVAGFSDARISLLSNEKQQGLSRSLNRGLDQTKGKYVARMDHDDISHRLRLEKQLEFLESHQDLDVLGTWARTLGGKKEQIWRYPARDEDIRSELIFNPVLVHGSVMLRKSTFDKFKLRYDPKISRAQDYELWTRAAAKVRFANIPSVLLEYRIHDDQVGKQHGGEQQKVAASVRAKQLKSLGLTPSRKELELHNRISRWELPKENAELRALKDWFLKLSAANLATNTLPRTAFERALEKRWWAACRANVDMGLEAWRMYTSFPIRASGRKGLEKAEFIAKASLRQLFGRTPG